MISVNKVTVSYGKERLALSDISLEIDSSIVILGEEGSGKTTFAKLLCGQLTPRRGQITVNGLNAKSRRAAENIGYMPQSCHLCPTLSISETLGLMAELRGLTKADVDLALDSAELTPKEAYSPVRVLGDLSKRKAMLAYALLGSPEYLVIDQPLYGLEPTDEDKMTELLTSLSDAYKLIYLTDSVKEARAHSDRVLLLSNGRSVGLGSIDSILSANENSSVYKGKARGDSSAIRAVLENCDIITKHKVSITASGTALMEITASVTDGLKERLAELMEQADCKLLELKKAPSTSERAITRLLEDQAEKDMRRRMKAEEKAPPVKLSAEHMLFRHNELDKKAEDTDDTGKPQDTKEETTASTLGIEAIFSFRRESTEEADSETDPESTLFSFRDDD